MTDKPVVIGRITELNGRTVVVPLDHRAQTLQHQKRVNELINAARAYAAEQTEPNTARLLRAARSLDT